MPGDQIEIIVFDYSEFTGRKVVLPDGTIALPLVGLVPIAGRTPAQVAQDLTARLGVWVRDPVVSVDLVKLRYR
uniref:Polysaccharide biosynthesis/export family protein n=1 Tax=Desertifilum tharense IPPAS B-1220 TaxID=1781255 RepID=A0ACD5GMS7_9CYAN